MIWGSHVIISAYGFWLPNDPRGSWSDFVRQWELFRYGPATKVETRQSVAYRPFDKALRDAAKRALTYPPVIFDGLQARAVARGFSRAVDRTGCVIHACSILPDHVHLVLKRHRYRMQQLVNLLKGDATRRLREEGIHPMTRQVIEGTPLPSPWARNHWMVYIDNDKHFRAAIKYVEDNPGKEGKSKQGWSFVSPYP